MVFRPRRAGQDCLVGTALRGGSRGLRGLAGFTLAVRQPEAYSASRASDVDYGDEALHFVMAGLVEEVAETDYSRGFPDEVHRQAGRGASEHPHHRIQFLSATLQVSAGHRKIGAIRSCGGDEQHAILDRKSVV